MDLPGTATEFSRGWRFRRNEPFSPHRSWAGLPSAFCDIKSLALFHVRRYTQVGLVVKRDPATRAPIHNESECAGVSACGRRDRILTTSPTFPHERPRRS